jgi:hypothetical protein
MNYENKLLIETSKLDFDPRSLEYGTKGINWDYVVTQAMAHNTIPVLFHNLSTNKLSMPNHLKELLLSFYQIKKIRGEIMQQEFLNVLADFENSGIKVVVLKGVYLASCVYKDVALRPFGDMDILINKEDAHEVFSVLEQAGYSQSELDPNTGELVPLSEERLAGYSNELQHFGEFRKSCDSPGLKLFNIDVHHNLSTKFDDFNYNIVELMGRSVSDKIADVNIYRLSNEDFLTHLCSHLYWHTQSLRDIINGNDAQLLAYSDIRNFIHTFQIDWELLIDRAERANLLTAILFTLHHCQLIFGDIVPERIYEKWDQEYLKEIGSLIYDRWITRDNKVNIGRWSDDFMTRLFDPNRSSAALASLYDDYIEPVLHRGAVFKVLEISDPNR